MYGIVDKGSELNWAAKDHIELMHFGKTRKTRTQVDDKTRQESSNWQKEFCGSIGYGEITRVSKFSNLQGGFTNYLQLIQNIAPVVQEACQQDGLSLNDLPFELADYDFKSDKSTFLDIGSGFGKPNFHVAM